MKLIACLSTGKGTWGHVARLVTDGDWEEVFLITNDFGEQNYKNDKKAKMVLIDHGKGITEMREDIITKLKGPLGSDVEVAVNLVSGDGKLHMALISALLQCGVGIKLMALTKDGINEI